MRSDWSVQVRTFFLGTPAKGGAKGAEIATIVQASSRDIGQKKGGGKNGGSRKLDQKVPGRSAGNIRSGFPRRQLCRLCGSGGRRGRLQGRPVGGGAPLGV